ncbi:MAG: hypothetical protein P1S60_08030 [Anaerolineae bacterium]|nr:hypothetical protein [Anaerolineae bacterium]
MKEIAPGIFLESTYAPYNLVLIKAEDSVVAVDVPPNPLDAMQWRENILSITNRIDYLVLTDSSPERQMPAMLWDTPIIASETTYAAMAVYDEERSRRELSQRYMDLYPEAGQFMEFYKPRRPMIAFNHRFYLHNRTPPLQFEGIEGAAPGSLWIILPDLGLLIAGETVSVDDVPCFTYVKDSKSWLRTLATLSRRQAIKKIIPGRGTAPIPRGSIEQQREFLRVMRRTSRMLARGSLKLGKLSECASDLGQSFFNNRGQRAIKEIKRGLEILMEEYRQEQPAELNSGNAEDQAVKRSE